MRHITGESTRRQLTHFERGTPVSKSAPVPITNFRELVVETAELAYLNKDHLLFFRGQGRDYVNKSGASTIYPSIYRGERVTRAQLQVSWDIMEAAARRLCDAIEEGGIGSHRDVRRRRYIQWSILQHYEVCPTPLLDLTQSLRVACSFAFLARRSSPIVMAFGMPYVTNRISLNSEHDLVNVRLLSICPPEALRPYFQEGYLAGTDEVAIDFESKTELDFNNRLVAKYVLADREKFWRGGFRAFAKKVLYPPDDRMLEICEGVKADLGSGVTPGRLGEFLQAWTIVEARLLEAARGIAPSGKKIYSVVGAIRRLARSRRIPDELVKTIHKIRQIRNEAVHSPAKSKPESLANAVDELRSISVSLDQLEL